MAARGPDGGIKPWTPKHKDADGAPSPSATGQRDGGAALRSGVKNGGVVEWKPKANGASNGALTSFVPKNAPAPEAPAKSAPATAAPCVGCAGKLQLEVGTKDALRRKLAGTLAGMAEFAMSLFDAALVEATATSEASAAPYNFAPVAWADRGFSVAAKGGALVVTGVDPDSPADQAGLDVGDRIVSVENAPKVDSIALFAEKMSSTTFDTNKLIVERNGVRLPVEIARA